MLLKSLKAGNRELDIVNPNMAATLHFFLSGQKLGHGRWSHILSGAVYAVYNFLPTSLDPERIYDCHLRHEANVRLNRRSIQGVTTD